MPSMKGRKQVNRVMRERLKAQKEARSLRRLIAQSRARQLDHLKRMLGL